MLTYVYIVYNIGYILYTLSDKGPFHYADKPCIGQFINNR
jgi:hypothetical protein